MTNKNSQIYIGKVKSVAKGKGWFFGHFMKQSPLKSRKVEIAWQDISNEKPGQHGAHYHRWTTEINIVISGAIRFMIKGRKHVARRGEFFVIPPGVVIERVSAGPNTQIIVVRTASLPKDKRLVA